MSTSARVHSLLASSLTMLGLTACGGGSSARPSAPTTAPATLPTSPHVVTTFAAAKGELPEGVYVDGDTAYVGFAPTGEIRRIDLRTGDSTPFGNVPAPVPGKGFMTGLALGPDGDLYVALVSFVPEVEAGIYRIGRAGGAGVLFAHDPAMPFPNGLGFDDDGTLYVSDSGTGSVFQIDARGGATRWADDEALTGAKDNCGVGVGAAFDIGANGLVVADDGIYVANNDRATIVKLRRDDAAAEIVAGPDCANLGGADDLVADGRGGFVVALNRQDRVVHVGGDGAITDLAAGAPFDFPASLAWHGDALVVTSFALGRAMAGSSPAPALVTLTP